MNVLVGPNNSGKSTIIRAFRILEVALRQARTKKATRIQMEDRTDWGYRVSERVIPVSLENVHTDYEATHARVSFRCGNGNLLNLVFPPDGGCILFPDAQGKQCHTPGRFRNLFPVSIQTIPELGPLEDEEKILAEHTVRQGLSTHRASRHFRNYWRLFPTDFDKFAQMIAKTWPGMEIEFPECADLMSQRLTMFCRKNNMTREIYWAGFRLQVWCQLLAHISRANNATMLVVDEPEIYLHPDVQRQLVSILRDAEPDIVVASHSTEIIGESDASEVVLVDKHKRSVTRLKDIAEIQIALDTLGSIHNVVLAHLARTKRLLYVENTGDDKIMRLFARKLGYIELASGNHITVIASEGFGAWKKIEASAWAFERALQGRFRFGVIFDRDYFSDEEIGDVRDKLSGHFFPAHIHERKEIENYLLAPKALERSIQQALRERTRRTGTNYSIQVDVLAVLEDISEQFRDDVISQLVGKRTDFLQGTKKDSVTITREVIEEVTVKWDNLETRLILIPGKKVLKRFRERIMESYSINLTDTRIVDAFSPDEVPNDMKKLIYDLEDFRISN